MTAKQLALLISLISALPSQIFAQASLNVGVAPGFPGATVSVPVTLRQPSGRVVAAQFDLAFDASKVSALAALRGEGLTNHVIRSRQIAPGVERVLIYSVANAPVTPTNVTMANVPFAVSPTEYVGSGPLLPGNVLLAQADASPLEPVNLGSGTIFVRAVNLLPGGEAQFFLPATPNQRYAIQATTNFVNWLNISTNTATSSFLDLLDVDAARYPYRFYRWELR